MGVGGVVPIYAFMLEISSRQLSAGREAVRGEQAQANPQWIWR